MTGSPFEIDMLWRAVGALHAALARYGRHDQDCQFLTSNRACTCGYAPIVDTGLVAEGTAIPDEATPEWARWLHTVAFTGSWP